MRIPNSRDRDDLRDERSMTAMIDVVFLLLIFFVCASIGQMGELLIGGEMSGGSIEAADPRPRKDLLPDVWVFMRRENGETVVQVNEGEGGTEYRGKAAEFRTSADYGRLVEIFKALAETSAEIPVIFDIKPDVFMGDQLAVQTAANNAGFQNIKFATEAKPKQAP